MMDKELKTAQQTVSLKESKLELMNDGELEVALLGTADDMV